MDFTGLNFKNCGIVDAVPPNKDKIGWFVKAWVTILPLKKLDITEFKLGELAST